jgi:hypothetical protein
MILPISASQVARVYKYEPLNLAKNYILLISRPDGIFEYKKIVLNYYIFNFIHKTFVEIFLSRYLRTCINVFSFSSWLTKPKILTV